MKITHQIATHIMDCFNGENWTDVNISDTLRDVNWLQAHKERTLRKTQLLLYYIIYITGMEL